MNLLVVDILIDFDLKYLFGQKIALICGRLHLLQRLRLILAHLYSAVEFVYYGTSKGLNKTAVIDKLTLWSNCPPRPKTAFLV